MSQAILEDDWYVIVTEKIINTSTVIDVFNSLEGKAQKLALLFSICEELANQHKKGVSQKDLHLANFLVSGESIFTLDPGQTISHLIQDNTVD